MERMSFSRDDLPTRRMDFSRSGLAEYTGSRTDWSRPVVSTAEAAAQIDLLKANTLIGGTSQMGKSTFLMEKEIWPLALTNECYVDVKDWARSLGERAAVRLLKHGYGRRVHVEDYSRFDLMSSPGLLRASRNSDPVQREDENLDQAEIYSEGLCGCQGYKLNEHPQIREWSIASIMFWLYQEPVKPIDYLLSVLRPGTNHFLEMLQGCTHPRYREKMFRLARFNSEVALYKEVGATGRVFSQALERPAVAQRMVQTYTQEDLVRGRFVVIHLGSGKPTDRVLFRLHNLGLRRLAREHWQRVGKPLWMRSVNDEAHNYVGELEATGAAEDLKMGLSWSFCSTRLDYGNDAVNELLDQNCHRKILFRCGASIADAASKGMRPNLDPYLKHHTEEREVTQLVGQDEVPQESLAEAFDREGKKVQLKRTGTAVRSRYEKTTHQTDHYFAVRDQDLMNTARLQRQGRGQYTLVEGDQVESKTVAPNTDVEWWSDEEGRRTLEDFLNRRGETGRYRAPRPLEEAQWVGNQRENGNGGRPNNPPRNGNNRNANNRNQGRRNGGRNGNGGRLPGMP